MAYAKLTVYLCKSSIKLRYAMRWQKSFDVTNIRNKVNFLQLFSGTANKIIASVYCAVCSSWCHLVTTNVSIYYSCRKSPTCNVWANWGVRFLYGTYSPGEWLLIDSLKLAHYSPVWGLTVNSSQLTSVPTSKSHDTKTRPNIKNPAGYNLHIVP